jgi:hypothetical protein
MTDEYRCAGTWTEIAPQIGECSMLLDCDALELFADFDAYRLAHERHRDPNPKRRLPFPRRGLKV